MYAYVSHSSEQALCSLTPEGETETRGDIGSWEVAKLGLQLSNN